MSWWMDSPEKGKKENCTLYSEFKNVIRQNNVLGLCPNFSWSAQDSVESHLQQIVGHFGSNVSNIGVETEEIRGN